MRRIHLAAGLSALLALPAAADWLVLRDGSRIETEGGWRTKGRQVIFTRAGGSLSALRLADVDLEASTEATAASEAAAAERATADPAAGQSKPRRRASVLVLTDEDIRPADEVAADEVPDEADAEETETVTEQAGTEPGAAEAEVEPVVLVSWESRESSDVDGLELIGSVRNTGDNIAASLSVKVHIRNEEGDPLLDTRAFLQSPSLAPGQSATFRVLLPGIYTLLADPTFELSSAGFSISGPRRSQDETDQDGARDSAESGEN